MIKRIIPVAVIVILALFSVFSMFSAGYFPMHDDTQVARVVTMGKALREAQLPVRWVSDLGYGFGYPIFNFYAPLPYYFGGFFYQYGVDGITATKIMFITGVVLSALIAYWAILPVSGISGAMLSSILLVFAPYHAVQIYVRGSVGEYWALAFLPLLFSAVIDRRNLKNRIAWGGLALAGVILSHNILGYISVGILGFLLTSQIIIFILFKRDHKEIFNKAGILITGLGLTAFFWMPAIAEMPYTRVWGRVWDNVLYSDHFICPSQLWNSLWGFAGSAPGCMDGMSFMLGKIHILAAVIGLAILVMKIRNRTNTMYIAGAVLIAGGIFMTLAVSDFIWKLIPNSQYFQYPWRFLNFVILGISVLSAIIPKGLGKTSPAAVLFLIVLTVFFNLKWFRPQFTYNPPDKQFESREDISYRASRISNEYLSRDFIPPGSQNQIPERVIDETPGFKALEIENMDTYKRYNISSDTVKSARINLNYFPGWEFRLNSHPLKAENANGLFMIELPKGEYTLEMIFRNTPVRTFSNLLSIVSVIILVFIYGKKTVY